MSEESLLLLSRAQWLVDRYKNKMKSDMMAEHMRNTVSLVASSAPYTNQFSQIPPTKQVFIPPTVKQTMKNNDMIEEYQHNVLSDGIAAGIACLNIIVTVTYYYLFILKLLLPFLYYYI